MNVISYFLIVLGGFGIVWGYRAMKYKGVFKPPLGDFEYAAFSAIWGSIPVLPVLIILSDNETVLQLLNQVPFIVSPLLFIAGSTLGALAVIFTPYLKRFHAWYW